MKTVWICMMGLFLVNLAMAAPEEKKLKIDFKTGNIEIADKEAKVKISIPLDDSKLLLRNDYEEILVPKNMSKERQQVANLLNLESRYISGHMSIPVGDKNYELSFTDFLSIQKYRAELAAHKANPKAPAPQEFTKAELSHIQEFEKSLQTSILNLLDKQIPDENKKHLDQSLEEERKKFITENKTDKEKMESHVKSITEVSSVLIIGLIDNQPYVLDNAHGLQIQSGLITLRSPSGDLNCPGLSDTPLPPSQTQVRIDNSYAYISPNAGAMSYSCIGENCTALVRTQEGTVSCRLTDNIFKSGFEANETGADAPAIR
jgi:hypothetical protein